MKTPTPLVHSPLDLSIMLHQPSLLGRVCSYNSIRDSAFESWDFMQKSLQYSAKENKLSVDNFFISLEMIDMFNKKIDECTLLGLIETEGSEFSFLLERGLKSNLFGVPLNSIDISINRKFHELSRLTFTKSPMYQNYTDILRYKSKNIFALEMQLYCKHSISFYPDNFHAELDVEYA